MGQDIFREVTQQNDPIDEIDERADNVNQRLVDTTSSVRVVSRKDLWVLGCHPPPLHCYNCNALCISWRNVYSLHLQRA
jgi:hypothetical protein